MGDTESERRGIRRGTRIAIGATAVAAALGAGTFVLTDRLTKNPASSMEVGAPARPGAVASPASGAPPVSASGSASAAPPMSASAIPQVSASASAVPIPKAVRKKIVEEREKSAKDGVKVTRPLPGPTRSAVALKRSTVGTLSGGGIVRVVTARSDLTGQEELAWVAGGVTKHGDADCSQTFRFSANAKPMKRPNMLLCWKTSPTKSVVAISVAPQGSPSRDQAVAELDKKWKSLK
jgi:hypothetical protein